MRRWSIEKKVENGARGRRAQRARPGPFRICECSPFSARRAVICIISYSERVYAPVTGATQFVLLALSLFLFPRAADGRRKFAGRSRERQRGGGGESGGRIFEGQVLAPEGGPPRRRSKRASSRYWDADQAIFLPGGYRERRRQRAERKRKRRKRRERRETRV